MNKNKREKGNALLLTMIILSAAMLIAMLIATVVVVQFKLSSDVNYSMIAVYAADSGVEWQLYQIRYGDTVPAPVMSNGASISTTVIGDYPSFTLKSLGAYKEVVRQFEINF
ncbi:MAG: pilus assembly PilX N-terminal domain-containing protein [Patescibacteria group bacterium]